MAWVPILYAIKQRGKEKREGEKKKNSKYHRTFQRGWRQDSTQEHVYNFSVLIIKIPRQKLESTTHRPQRLIFCFVPEVRSAFTLIDCISVSLFAPLPLVFHQFWLLIDWINYQDTLASIKQYLRRCILAYRLLTNLELKSVNIMKCTY